MLMKAVALDVGDGLGGRGYDGGLAEICGVVVGN